jgi:hypothetical protein
MRTRSIVRHDHAQADAQAQAQATSPHKPVQGPAMPAASLAGCNAGSRQATQGA